MAEISLIISFKYALFLKEAPLFWVSWRSLEQLNDKTGNKFSLLQYTGWYWVSLDKKKTAIEINFVRIKSKQK